MPPQQHAVDLERAALAADRTMSNMGNIGKGKDDKEDRSVDLSHHLSRIAAKREASPIKDLFKYGAIPGTIMMAGGLPSPTLFPFESLSAQVLVPSSFSPSESKSTSPSVLDWFWKLFSDPGPTPTTKPMTIPKYLENPKDTTGIQLSTALQYGVSTGLPPLAQFVHHFTHSVFRPLSPSTETLLHIGSTFAWTNCLGTFCERGEFVLTEDWAYVSALVACVPFGVKPVGVGMDGGGMRADLLEGMLENWDEGKRGGPRPHVMYTVPIGQNPCGTSMGLARKKAVYEVCVKYDVIIIEDDPYYFLQCGEYEVPSLRAQKEEKEGEKDPQEFIDSLIPSFLRVDYQGRVVRIDTFSKTIAPGSRLGWYTCNPLFRERLERGTDSTTQQPSGYSQALIAQLLTQQWKFPGFITWLNGLQSQYTLRRDHIIDSISHYFDMVQQYDMGEGGAGSYFPLVGPAKVFVARSKGKGRGEKGERKVLFSFVAPVAGMFLWLKVHLYNHPHYSPDTPPPTTPADTLEYKLWVELALAGFLVAPGWIFGSDPDATISPDEDLLGSGMGGVPGVYEADMPVDKRFLELSDGGRYGHLRISYSDVTPQNLETGLGRFAEVLDKQFYPKSK